MKAQEENASPSGYTKLPIFLFKNVEKRRDLPCICIRNVCGAVGMLCPVIKHQNSHGKGTAGTAWEFFCHGNETRHPAKEAPGHLRPACAGELTYNSGRRRECSLPARVDAEGRRPLAPGIPAFPEALTPRPILLLLCSMDTLGDALAQGWVIALRCQRPSRIGTTKVGRCEHSMTLHLPTLVATRGAAFPISMLQSRLKCPRCQDRRVVVVFTSRPETPAAAMRG